MYKLKICFNGSLFFEEKNEEIYSLSMISIIYFLIKIEIYRENNNYEILCLSNYQRRIF